jgi:hypothetical protein
MFFPIMIFGDVFELVVDAALTPPPTLEKHAQNKDDSAETNLVQ